MQVLIIDNKDSFTYNLAHYVQQFTDNIDVFRPCDIAINQISKYTKIILSPGPGLPYEHPILKQLLKVYSDKKSILGICLGHQGIAEYFGATLENMTLVKHGVSSKINQCNNCSIFNDLPNTFQIGHYHSWVVSKEKFPKCLEITSENDEGIITSFKHKEFDVKGIQFHPESILTEHGLKIIKNWLFS